MGLFDKRDVVAFPKFNTSEFTTLNGLPFNLTSLREWNYTLYSNRTVSNDSNCVLVFGKYAPESMFTNGSWVNGTSCYNPIFKIRTRGLMGIPIAGLYAIVIVLALGVLRKHGQHMLPELKRFRAAGRRWPWYWMLFSAACAIISCITGIDIDRSYVQYLPIIMSSFFFVLTAPASMAMVWEMTRHWGSWQLRQITDRDNYAFREEDRRAKVEFYLPLVFYLFDWLYFFMTIPRTWGKIQLQRSPDQTIDQAIPAATDGRFKTSFFFLLICWCLTVFSMLHSIKYYRPTNPRPIKIVACLAVLLVKIGYLGAMAWNWHISFFNASASPVVPFILGFGPDLLVMAIMLIASGLIEENEDLQLLRQRRQRDAEADGDLGFVTKPRWWRLGKVEVPLYSRKKGMSVDDRLHELAAKNPAVNRERKYNPAKDGISGLDFSVEIPLRDLNAGSGLATGNDQTVYRRSPAASSPTSETPAPPAYGEQDQKPVRSMLDV